MFRMDRNPHAHWSLAQTAPPGSPLAGILVTLQEDTLALTQRQLRELGRMRGVAMKWVDRLEMVLDGRLDPDADPVMRRSRGFISDLVQVYRAIRQIMVLEQELRGLRPSLRKPPREDDDDDGGEDEPFGPPGRRKLKGLAPLRPLRTVLPPDDQPDIYDRRPVDQAVGWIRETLNIDVPTDDPFAPPAEASAPEPEAAAEMPAVTEKRVRGRAYDLDFRDQPGEDLDIGSADGDAKAGLPVRGPP